LLWGVAAGDAAADAAAALFLEEGVLLSLGVVLVVHRPVASFSGDHLDLFLDEDTFPEAWTSVVVDQVSFVWVVDS
jgi:hypothetical protein